MEGVDWDLALGVNSLGDEPWTVEDDDKEFEEAEIEKDKLSEEAKMEDCKGVEGSTKKSWFSWGS